MPRKNDGSKTGDREVGYGKPPVASRFQPGNPGRPPGTGRKSKSSAQTTMSAAFTEAMTRKRPVKIGDDIVEKTAMELIPEKMVSQAIQGTPREKAQALAWINKMGPELFVPPPMEITVTFYRAPGSTVVLPPSLSSKKRGK